MDPAHAQSVKVCIRRLPSSMNEAAFMTQVEKIGVKARLVYFVPGCVKGRKVTYSRGYVELFSRQDAEAFHVGCLQKWEASAKLPPVIEPSAYQRIPRGIERPDEEAGKLEEYEPFKKFMEEMNKEKVTLPGADVQLERRQQSGEGDKKEPIISPLLRDVMEKKMTQLEKDRANLKKDMLNKQRNKGRGQRRDGQGQGQQQGQGNQQRKNRGQRRQRNKQKRKPE